MAAVALVLASMHGVSHTFLPLSRHDLSWRWACLHTTPLYGVGKIVGDARLNRQRCAPCAQVKSLSNLGWFLSIGTFGQLFAGVVVIYKLLAAPWADAVTEVVHTDEASTSLVAVMNIIFA